MTGLDQEMMQKNISVKTLKDSQKNMISFSVVMLLVNFLFLFLGGLLTLYASDNQLLLKGDDLFPSIAMQQLPPAIGLIFIIGLISALFPSADGAITALTSSFCIDILRLENNENKTTEQKMKTRKMVHLSFAFLFMLLVLYFKMLDNKEIVTILLDIAGYTYGPLLGLFAFGLFTKFGVRDRWVLFVCFSTSAIGYLINQNAERWLNGYKFGFEFIIFNGLLTFIGLWIIKQKQLTN